MKKIDSRQNPSFKWLKELVGQARARRAHQAAWLEGERLCGAYIEHQVAAQPAGSALPQPVLVADASVTDQVAARLQQHLQDCWVLDEKLFSEISQVASGPRWGLIIPALPGLPRAAAEARAADVVILDRLQDPGNLGTLMRSAAAAGIEEVWCLEPTVDVWSPKVLRAAMGAHFVMHVVAALPERELFAHLKERKLTLLAADHGPGAASIYAPSIRLKQPCAWVFGQEGSGVAETILSKAQRVEIPQSDRVESLNVSAAAAVCLFEMVRQRS